MSFLVKEYDVPFLGKVKFIEATEYDKSFNGKYYASNKKLGEGFCKDCNSLEELKEKANKEIVSYLRMKKRTSELTIESEKEKINKLESHLSEAKSNDWMEKYQTRNHLQLEFQEKEKQN